MVVAVICLAVVGCVVTLGPAIGPTVAIMNDSGGRVRSVNYYWLNGTDRFDIVAAPGIGPDRGAEIACQVVRPGLKGTKYEHTHFFVFDWVGDVIATDQTPCAP